MKITLYPIFKTAQTGETCQQSLAPSIGSSDRKTWLRNAATRPVAAAARMVCTMTLLTGMSLTMAPSASANSVADLETELGECSLRGDADLDGDVDSDDLVVGFQAGKWNTGEYATAFEGDANGDFVYDSADLVQIFQDGGYRDSGCGFGVPFGLTKAVVLEIIEALEEAQHVRV